MPGLCSRLVSSCTEAPASLARSAPPEDSTISSVTDARSILFASWCRFVLLGEILLAEVIPDVGRLAVTVPLLRELRWFLGNRERLKLAGVGQVVVSVAVTVGSPGRACDRGAARRTR